MTAMVVFGNLPHHASASRRFLQAEPAAQKETNGPSSFLGTSVPEHHYVGDSNEGEVQGEAETPTQEDNLPDNTMKWLSDKVRVPKYHAIGMDEDDTEDGGPSESIPVGTMNSLDANQNGGHPSTPPFTPRRSRVTTDTIGSPILSPEWVPENVTPLGLMYRRDNHSCNISTEDRENFDQAVCHLSRPDAEQSLWQKYQLLSHNYLSLKQFVDDFAIWRDKDYEQFDEEYTKMERKNQTLQQELDDLKKTISYQAQTIEDLQKGLRTQLRKKNAQKDTLILENAQRVKELQQRLNTQEGDYENKNSAKERLMSEQAQKIQELEREVKRLNTEKSELDTKLHSANLINRDNGKVIAGLKKKLIDFYFQEGALKAVKTKSEQFESQLQAAHAKNGELEGRLRKALEWIREAETKESDLERRLVSSEESNRKLLEENQRLQLAVHQLVGQNQSLQLMIRQLTGTEPNRNLYPANDNLDSGKVTIPHTAQATQRTPSTTETKQAEPVTHAELPEIRTQDSLERMIAEKEGHIRVAENNIRNHESAGHAREAELMKLRKKIDDKTTHQSRFNVGLDGPGVRIGGEITKLSSTYNKLEREINNSKQELASLHSYKNVCVTQLQRLEKELQTLLEMQSVQLGDM